MNHARALHGRMPAGLILSDYANASSRITRWRRLEDSK
jgi:hypothetical protein